MELAADRSTENASKMRTSSSSTMDRDGCQWLTQVEFFRSFLFYIPVFFSLSFLIQLGFFRRLCIVVYFSFLKIYEKKNDKKEKK